MVTKSVEGAGGFVDLASWRAHIVEWDAASDDAPCVLLLHGSTGFAESWSVLAAMLAPSFHLVALDQRGHGHSDPTDAFGTRPMVADIVLLLDALGWKRASIVGASMGGMNALIFAALHPARVDRLVLVDIGPVVGVSDERRAQRTTPTTFTSRDEALAWDRRAHPHSDPAFHALRATYNLEAVDGEWRWLTDDRLLRRVAARDDYTPDERQAAWSALSVPTLVIHGVDSDLLTSSLILDMHESNPLPRVVDIDGCGHSVTSEQPEAMGTAVLAFLEEPRPDA